MAIESSNIGPIEETVQGWQDGIEGRVRSLQTGSYARILKMARKPSKQEFRQTVIVCGIGMLSWALSDSLCYGQWILHFPSSSHG